MGRGTTVTQHPSPIYLSKTDVQLILTGDRTALSRHAYSHARRRKGLTWSKTDGTGDEQTSASKLRTAAHHLHAGVSQAISESVKRQAGRHFLNTVQTKMHWHQLRCLINDTYGLEGALDDALDSSMCVIFDVISVMGLLHGDVTSAISAAVMELDDSKNALADLRNRLEASGRNQDSQKGHVEAVVAEVEGIREALRYELSFMKRTRKNAIKSAGTKAHEQQDHSKESSGEVEVKAATIEEDIVEEIHDEGSEGAGKQELEEEIKEEIMESLPDKEAPVRLPGENLEITGLAATGFKTADRNHGSLKSTTRTNGDFQQEPKHILKPVSLPAKPGQYEPEVVLPHPAVQQIASPQMERHGNVSHVKLKEVVLPHPAVQQIASPQMERHGNVSHVKLKASLSKLDERSNGKTDRFTAQQSCNELPLNLLIIKCGRELLADRNPTVQNWSASPRAEQNGRPKFLRQPPGRSGPKQCSEPTMLRVRRNLKPQFLEIEDILRKRLPNADSVADGAVAMQVFPHGNLSDMPVGRFRSVSRFW